MHLGVPGYWKNGFNMFYGNDLVPGANPMGFEDLGGSWGKDMHRVYYMGRVVSDAQPFFFQTLGNGYAKDNHHVYRCGEVMSNADPFFFQVPPTGSYHPSTTVIEHHHHHPATPISSCTSVRPAYVHSTVPIEVRPSVYLPPPSPLPMATSQLSAHVTMPSRQVGGQIIRTHDSVDCCTLI